MLVKLDESGYKTLKMFLLSCPATVGEKALDKYYQYKGKFPVLIEDILGEFSWVITEIPNNAFARLIDYAEIRKTEIVGSEFICLFFGGKEHLAATQNTCVIFDDLTNDEKMAGHMAMPIKVQKIEGHKISGQIIRSSMKVENVYNVFSDVSVGDTVLVHFATVVLPNPSETLTDQLIDRQKSFRENELIKVDKIKYKLAFRNTRKKIKKVLGLG